MDENLSGNIIYKWWCPKCVTDHYTEYCPRDELESAEFANTDDKASFEFCPNCGQLIKRED